MKKKFKKIISVVLAVLCLSTCLVGVIAHAEPVAGQPKTNHAIVLVLDVSGSMEGIPLAKMKESAIEFSKKILEANPDNQIAIVNFSGYSDVKEFSNNIDELSSYINRLYAYGGTNMADAIDKAGDILDGFSKENYRKSIVMMADGMPDSTQSAINSATALFNSYDLYSLGFFHSLSVYELTSARDFMQKIQNKGYYEVTDIDDLIEQFVKIAAVIINPFKVDLKATNIDSSEDYCTFEIEAKVTNSNTKYDSNNVSAVIKFNEDVEVITRNALQIGTIKSQSTKNAKWTVKIPINEDDRNVEYEVVVNSDNTLPLSTYGTLYIDGYNQKNNTLELKDTWSFKNYKVNKIKLTDDDEDALRYILERASAQEKKEIGDNLNVPVNGECYGMAVISALSKVGRISPNQMNPNALTLHEIEKNKKSMSMIGYYQLMQYLDVVTTEQETFKSKSVKEQLEIIKEMAQKIEKGGTPFVLGFYKLDEKGDLKGHAVTGYGFEKCSPKYEFEGKPYDSKILIYDTNTDFGNMLAYLYFNEGTDEWVIPGYDVGSRNSGAFLGLAIDNVNVMDCKNIEMSRKNQFSYIRTSQKTAIQILTPNNTYQYPFNIGQYKNVFLSTSFNGNSDYVKIGFSDGDQPYNISPVDNNKLKDISVYYKNYLIDVDSDKCNSADFNPDGRISINGNEGDFTISITSEDEVKPLKWPTIEISGNGKVNPKVSKTENGFILEGDNLKNITLLARYSEFDSNSADKKKIIFNTDKDSVLIGESNGNLTVSTDNDNDGKYETLISTSDSTVKSAQLENLEVSNVKLNPKFIPDTTVYNATVAHDVSSVELALKLKENTSATISVNSDKPVSFDFSKKYNYKADLNVGENKIIVNVTGANMTSTAYTINIKRLDTDSTESTIQNTKPETTTNENKSPNTGDTTLPIKIVTGIFFISLFVVSVCLLIRRKARQKMM